jgi:hypothetical protein
MVTHARAALAAVLALAAAPLHAQPADSAQSCVRSAAEEGGMTRWRCAGTDFDAAVRFSVALPDDWEVDSPRDAGLQVWALRDGMQIAVAAEDQLHEPRTRSDSLGFWMRATRLRLGREPGLADVDTFQRAARTPADARRAVTLAQQRDTVLLAMVLGLSAEDEGIETSVEAVEVRRLGGHPAGYLAETYAVRGMEWIAASYVTVHDAVVFIVTLTGPPDGYDAALPVWERVLASLEMRTERPGP